MLGPRHIGTNRVYPFISISQTYWEVPIHTYLVSRSPLRMHICDPGRKIQGALRAKTW